MLALLVLLVDSTQMSGLVWVEVPATLTRHKLEEIVSAPKGKHSSAYLCISCKAELTYELLLGIIKRSFSLVILVISTPLQPAGKAVKHSLRTYQVG